MIYAFNLVAEYQTSQDSLADIADTAKFNEQFTSYDRDDVKGYELLSLINKIIDYNETQTTDTINGNNEQYGAISITINMNGQAEKLRYNTSIQLFKQDSYTENELTAQNGTSRVSFKDNIIEQIKKDVENLGGTEAAAEKIAKSISSIFMTEDQINAKATKLGTKENVYQEMLKKYKSCTGEDITDINDLIIGKNASSNKYYTAACEYYEYIQFKRAIFKCTKFDYNQTTGRLDKIQFNFTGEIY